MGRVLTPARLAAQERKAAEHRFLTGLGHRMTWTSRHGVTWLSDQPGYKGECRICGDIHYVIPSGDTGYYAATDSAGRSVWAGRRCTTERPRATGLQEEETARG